MIEEIGAFIRGVRSIELDNAFYVEDGTWIESLTVTSTCEFDILAVIKQVSGAKLFHHSTIPTGPTGVAVERVVVTANEPYPFILGLVLRQGAIPNRIVYTGTQFRVIATVRDWEQFRAIADDIQHKLGQFQLERVNEIDDIGEPLDSGRLSETLITKLSEDQLVVLETAYNMGYFEVPRQANATEVASRLEISQSNFSERLRTAENNLLELVFGANVSQTETI